MMPVFPWRVGRVFAASLGAALLLVHSSLVAGESSQLDQFSARVAELRAQRKQVRVSLIHQSTLTAELLDWLASLPDLEVLHVDNTPLDDAGMQSLSRSKSLRRLTLNHTGVSDRGLEYLARIKTLEDLSLRAVGREEPITDAGVVHLAGLDRLWKLDLSANPHLSGAALEVISRLPRLRWLNLWRTPIRGEHLMQLSRSTTLEVLNLGGTRLDDNDLRRLQPLTRLRVLSLSPPGYRHVTDEQGQRVAERVDPDVGIEGPGLKHLWGLPIEELHYQFQREDLPYWAGLTELRTFGPHTRVEDRDLVYLRRLRRLQRLEIRMGDGWSDSSRLSALRGMDQLTDLTIRGAKPTNPPDVEAGNSGSHYGGLACLQELPKLERLKLTGVEDDALVHLASCMTLKTLDLRGTLITGTGLRHLPATGPLLALGLDGRILTDEGFSHLGQLSRILRLVLGEGACPQEGLVKYYRGRQAAPESVAWSPAGVTRLSDLPNLETLDLSGLPIGDAEVVELRQLQGLRELGLRRTKVGNAGVAAVAGLRTLRTIKLAHTNVGDDGILPLTDSPGLRMLDIVGTQVSREAAEKVYEAHRHQCRITDNWCCGCMSFEPLAEAP